MQYRKPHYIGYGLSVLGMTALIYGNTSYAADDEQDTQKLQTVTVQADREDPLEQGYVAPNSSVGSRTNASTLTTPSSVSVIGSKELQDRGAQTTTQALQYSPGLYANTSAISSRFDYFNIRGFDATLNGILLDGLRSTTQQTYVHYQPYGMERVEVLRGPSGFMYGAGSPGGIVNEVSKHPQKKPAHEVQLIGGSHNRKQIQFDTTGPLTRDKTLSYRLVGVARDSDTQFDHVPDDTKYIAPSLTWQPDDDTKLTILTSFSRDKFGPPPRASLPVYGTLLHNPNGKVDRNSYLDGTGLDNHLTQYNLGYEFEHAFSDRLSFNSSARYSYSRLMSQTLGGTLDPDMRTWNRQAYAFRISGRIFSTDNNFKGTWDWGPVQGTSVAGISYRHTREDYWFDGGSAPANDIYHPSSNGHISYPYNFTSTLQEADETGIYLVNNIEFLKNLNLDLSARQDWVSVSTDDRLNDSSTSQHDDHFTGRAGLSYKTPIGLAPYVSYTTSFAPVLGTDLYGQSFRPTTGKQWETGLKYQPDSLDAMFSLAWFHLKQNNVTVSDPDNPMNTLQTGQISSKGIEAAMTANITEELKLIASYTWNSLENTETTDPDAKGNRPTGLPKQMGNIWGDYTFSRGPLESLGIGLGVRYIGSTYADNKNSEKVSDYTIVDAAVRYNLGQLNSSLKGLNVAVNANNLFNKHYFTSCNVGSNPLYGSCNAGFDRSILATVGYDW